MPQVLVAGAFVAVCGLIMANSHEPRALSEVELRDRMIGKCVEYTGPTNGSECFSPDGTLVYDDDVWGAVVGIWEIRNDEFCVTYDDEPESCALIYETENGRLTDRTFSWDG